MTECLNAQNVSVLELGHLLELGIWILVIVCILYLAFLYLIQLGFD